MIWQSYNEIITAPQKKKRIILFVQIQCKGTKWMDLASAKPCSEAEAGQRRSRGRGKGTAVSPVSKFSVYVVNIYLSIDTRGSFLTFSLGFILLPLIISSLWLHHTKSHVFLKHPILFCLFKRLTLISLCVFVNILHFFEIGLAWFPSMKISNQMTVK